jgi:hypothetical protein
VSRLLPEFPSSAKIIVWRFDGRMAFVPEGQADSSQARSAWVAMQRGPVPEGRSKSLSVPQIFVVETEPRHEQATARRMRRMVRPLQKRQVFLWKSSGPMMFDLILDGMNSSGNCETLTLKVPEPCCQGGRDYFPDDPRHFVPDCYRCSLRLRD